MSEKILLLDNNNLFERAFYATYRPDQPVLSHNGFPTNAISTWASMILGLIRREKPDRFIFVMDGKPVVRRQLSAEYKGTRGEKPSPLSLQHPVAYQFIGMSGFEYAFDPNEEADDVIATLARNFASDSDVLIASADKDFGQVVSARITLLKPLNGVWERYTPAVVNDRFGVAPEMIANYLALRGDVQDNIPGVQGVGEKGAVKMLQDLPSFDQIVQRIMKYTRIDESSARLSLRANLDLTTFRHLEAIQVQRGCETRVALDRLLELNCRKAAAEFQQLLDGGQPRVAAPTPAPRRSPKASASQQMNLF